MLSPGTIVRYVGDERARRTAYDLGLESWTPLGIKGSGFGVCEKFSHQTTEGIKVYSCRFSINKPYPINSNSHYTGKFYEFEVEEV